MKLEPETLLVESHNYWLRQRIAFNIIVGFSGIIPVIDFRSQLNIFDFIGIVMWGILANALYSFGYTLDSLIITKTNGEKSLKRIREYLFWAGTICYVVLTIFYAYAYLTTQKQSDY